MNIYDLAREAGVSIATASKALNGRRDVNEQTRAKVLEMAKRLHYHPSHLARGLARRRTENIGVLAVRRRGEPFLTDSCRARVLEGLELEVTSRNYNLLLSILPAEDGAASPQLPKLVREKNADGLVLLGPIPEHLLEEVLERRIPAVSVDFQPPRAQGHCVVADQRGGLGLMVRHLAGLKHKRLAFLRPAEEDWSAAERRAGFEAACRELKLEPTVWALPYDGERIQAELGARLSSKDRPSALLAADDRIALAALKAARAQGLSVPRDLSVSGFEDLEAAAAAEPALSTLRVDRKAMGALAVRRLFKLMDPPAEASGREDLPAELVLRASTGPAPH